MKNSRKSYGHSGKRKPGSVFLPIKTVVLGLLACLLFSSCFKLSEDGDGPTNVHWKGQVIDAVSERPMAGQEVTLRKTYWNGFPHFTYGDTLDRTISDADGRFAFSYTDPDDATWFTVESSHPDYFTGRASLGHKEPPREEVQLDIPMKPKAWLKIRVLDVPEYDSDVGVIFADLNSENNLVSLLWSGVRYVTIKPSDGDTTFYAFKPGGEPTSFYYWNFDSVGMVRYEAVFTPFDTTELSFGY